MLVALVLPPLLVHSLAPAQYSAWVLVLQCSAYVNLLDLGLQTAIGKFVAEYDAIGARTVGSQILSSSFAILCVSAMIGAVGIAIITWRVPQLFHQMPPALVGDLREGILTIGLSTVFALPFGAFLAVFTGLQRYGFPTALALLSKILSSAALAGVLLMHGTLIQLVWVMAAFNVATAVIQFFGWRKYAKERVGFSWMLVNREVALRLIRYGSILSVWAVAGLFISGLDMVVVGHYDYKDTGYYGIASAVTNFMILVIGSLFGPLVPAVSSLHSEKTTVQLGEMVIRATRYCVLLVCLAGLPLIVGAYPILRFWVGEGYATRSAFFLQVLVCGSAIRQFGYPYSLVAVATGRQHLAALAGIVEAAVNVCVSIYLVQRIGAVGVAVGTLVGAFVSVGMHLTISMKLTSATISISRRDFAMEGLLRPLLCVAPSILLFTKWTTSTTLPASPRWLAAWAVSTLAIAWLFGLTREEKHSFGRVLSRLTYRAT
jgi:O-antigen/teichoic acid export membrane protein